MSTDVIAGAAHEGAGAIRQGVGEAAGRRMHAERGADTTGGSAKEAAGKAEDAIPRPAR